MSELKNAVIQQQKMLAGLQSRLETGLQSLQADLRSSFSKTATLDRVKEVESEMLEWSRRGAENEAQRSMRLEGVVDRCQHALVSASRHDSQLSGLERRLDTIEAQLRRHTTQQDLERQLETQAKWLLDHIKATDAKVGTVQETHTQDAAITAEWHNIHATKLAEHETLLGELQRTLRQAQSVSSDHSAKLEAIARRCEGIVEDSDRSRIAAERAMNNMSADVTKLQDRSELDGARSNAAASLTNAVTRLTEDLAEAIRSARCVCQHGSFEWENLQHTLTARLVEPQLVQSNADAFLHLIGSRQSAVENHAAAALVTRAGGEDVARTSFAAYASKISAADGAATFASKGMELHAALLAEEASGKAGLHMSENRSEAYPVCCYTSSVVFRCQTLKIAQFLVAQTNRS
ncbi:hypothetical protein N9K47_00220 [bacterium]|nr:hypothetical protein [bacterium]